MKTQALFPVGARVYIDGDVAQQAIVSQAFPEGSTSLLFPHYQLRPVGGTFDDRFCVNLNRVGVELKVRKMTPGTTCYWNDPGGRVLHLVGVDGHPVCPRAKGLPEAQMVQTVDDQPAFPRCKVCFKTG